MQHRSLRRLRPSRPFHLAHPAVLISLPFLFASCAWWHDATHRDDARTASSTNATRSGAETPEETPVTQPQPVAGSAWSLENDPYADTVVRSGAETPEEAALSTTPRERARLAGRERFDGDRFGDDRWQPGVQTSGSLSASQPAQRFDEKIGGRFDERAVAEWGAEPRAVIRQTCLRYGDPDVVAGDRLEWRDAGPYKRIVVRREAFRHDQPSPHVDVVTHTIAYEIPRDKVDDVEDFDRCLDADAARKELSASGPREAENVVLLNLAHSIAEGDMQADEARRQKQQALADARAGKDPELATALRFHGAEGVAAGRRTSEREGGLRDDVGTAEASAPRDRDEVKDAGARKHALPTEPEIVAKLQALDESEIQAAKDAQAKSLAEPVLEFARKLEKAHQDCRDETREVADELDISPASTSAISEMREKAAREREEIADLDGERFADAWLAQRIECHEKAISKIDEKLLPAARSEELREHLTSTRAKLADQLAEARRLRDR